MYLPELMGRQKRMELERQALNDMYLHESESDPLKRAKARCLAVSQNENLLQQRGATPLPLAHMPHGPDSNITQTTAPRVSVAASSCQRPDTISGRTVASPPRSNGSPNLVTQQYMKRPDD